MGKKKIAVCCTFGAGSSMMLKMNLDTVFGNMGLDAEVEVYDIASVSGIIGSVDAIYTSAALVEQIEQSISGNGVVVIPVVNYFDLPGLEALTKEFLLQQG